MDRDSKNIFKNYRILLEQQAGPSEADLNQRMNADQQVGQPNANDMNRVAVVTDIIIKSIQASPDVEDIVKQAIEKYISQPAFGQGLLQTIKNMPDTQQGASQQGPSEADLNDRAGADQAGEDGNIYSQDDVNQFLGNEQQ